MLLKATFFVSICVKLVLIDERAMATFRFRAILVGFQVSSLHSRPPVPGIVTSCTRPVGHVC